MGTLLSLHALICPEWPRDRALWEMYTIVYAFTEEMSGVSGCAAGTAHACCCVHFAVNTCCEVVLAYNNTVLCSAQP